MNIQPTVFLVDDDPSVRESLIILMETIGFPIETYNSAESFLKQYCPGKPGCLILDVKMPGMNGAELQMELARRQIPLPIIFLTGYGDIPMSVKAIKAGAIDFLTKPIRGKQLIECVKSAFEQNQTLAKHNGQRSALCSRIAGLTPREMDVMSLAVAGLHNKEIARRLGISYRTVEIHRARVMKKTECNNLLELAHICEECRLPSDS